MSLLVDFYSLGFVIAFMFSMYRLQEDGKVTGLDLLFSIFLAAFSWIGVLALLIGGVLRRNSEHYGEPEE